MLRKPEVTGFNLSILSEPAFFASKKKEFDFFFGTTHIMHPILGALEPGTKIQQVSWESRAFKYQEETLFDSLLAISTHKLFDPSYESELLLSKYLSEKNAVYLGIDGTIFVCTLRNKRVC